MASSVSDEPPLKRKISDTPDALHCKRPRDSPIDIPPAERITESENTFDIVGRNDDAKASSQVVNSSPSSFVAASIENEETGRGEISEGDAVAGLRKADDEEEEADEDDEEEEAASAEDEDEDDDVQEYELSEIDSEDDEYAEEDASEEDADDADREYRSTRSGTEDKEKGKEPDIKGKCIMVDDKGKGKAKVEDSESEQARDEEDDTGYLSEDPLDEVDLNNILPTRTRRRNRNVHFDPAELSNEGDNDDDDDDDSFA